MPAGTVARIEGSNAQKQNVTMSGGPRAGMMIGHMNGATSGAARSSAAVIAAKPDAGIKMMIARAAARGIAPFIAASTARTVSSPQRTIISRTPKACARALPAGSLRLRSESVASSPTQAKRISTLRPRPARMVRPEAFGLVDHASFRFARPTLPCTLLILRLLAPSEHILLCSDRRYVTDNTEDLAAAFASLYASPTDSGRRPPIRCSASRSLLDAGLKAALSGPVGPQDGDRKCTPLRRQPLQGHCG